MTIHIMDHLILGIWSKPNQFQRISVDVSMNMKVNTLKEEAAKRINKEKQAIELLYCGIVLDDDSTLESCGIKPGVMVHILEKKESPTPIPIRTMTETDVQQLVVAFRAFTLSAGYRTALQRLSRSEVLENIIVATPGLADDPVAIAMIQDPELIVHMSDPDTVRRIAEQHPSLIEAAHHIAAHVHEEAAIVNQTQATTSSGYSYSLEALSDDEEMDSSSSDPPRESQPLTRNRSYNAITAAQLAAAIANATTTSTFGLQTTPVTNTSNPSSSNVITSEMFNTAIQQAFNTVNTGNSNTTAPASNPSGNDMFEPTPRYQAQLRQMREMGLVNEHINMRALQTTSGDVQAAVELVLSGVFD